MTSQPTSTLAVSSTFTPRAANRAQGSSTPTLKKGKLRAGQGRAGRGRGKAGKAWQVGSIVAKVGCRPWGGGHSQLCGTQAQAPAQQEDESHCFFLLLLLLLLPPGGAGGRAGALTPRLGSAVASAAPAPPPLAAA